MAGSTPTFTSPLRKPLPAQKELAIGPFWTAPPQYKRIAVSTP